MSDRVGSLVVGGKAGWGSQLDTGMGNGVKAGGRELNHTLTLTDATAGSRAGYGMREGVG
jgi:hypothetical protein